MSNEVTKKKETLIKDTMILCAITLVAGLLLGIVYDVTAPIIAERRLQSKIEAYQNVFQVASEIVEEEELNTEVEAASAFLESNGYEGITVDEAMVAVDTSGSLLGYVFTVTTSNGYKGDITMTIGYSLDGVVTGMEFLTINETVGLGSKAQEPGFKGQFVDKQVSSFELKKGSAANDGEVDAISGATITSRAVLNAVNAGISFIQQSVITN